MNFISVLQNKLPAVTNVVILLVNEYSVLVPSPVKCCLPVGNLYIG